MAQPRTDIKRKIMAPKRKLPAGAWDTHAHVFGPYDRFPLLEPRRYDPPYAPAAYYYEMLETMGFAHGVLAHSAAQGYDNACLSDAALRSGGRAQVSGILDPARASVAELRVLASKRLSGLRFTSNGARVGPTPGALELPDLKDFAPWLKELGWHAEIWAKCEFIVAAAADLKSYGIPIVFDHMGYYDKAKDVTDAIFQDYLRLLRDGDFWVKLTPTRVTNMVGDYSDVRPFFDAIVKAIPDRVVFGSDWPYISMDASPPNVGDVIDVFDGWIDDAQRQKIYVDNPKRLFGRWY